LITEIDEKKKIKRNEILYIWHKDKIIYHSKNKRLQNKNDHKTSNTLLCVVLNFNLLRKNFEGLKGIFAFWQP